MLGDFSHGPALMDTLVNVILVTSTSPRHVEDEKIPANVISVTFLPACYYCRMIFSPEVIHSNKTIGSTSISHRSDAKLSHRCLIKVGGHMVFTMIQDIKHIKPFMLLVIVDNLVTEDKYILWWLSKTVLPKPHENAEFTSCSITIALQCCRKEAFSTSQRDRFTYFKNFSQ